MEQKCSDQFLMTFTFLKHSLYIYKLQRGKERHKVTLELFHPISPGPGVFSLYLVSKYT